MTDNYGAAPSAGAQDFLASVTAAYTGGGSADISEIDFDSVGAHNYTYSTDLVNVSCGNLPPPGRRVGPHPATSECCVSRCDTAV